MKITLPLLTTALDMAGLVLALAGLAMLCILVPPVGLLLLSASVLLLVSWAIERTR